MTANGSLAGLTVVSQAGDRREDGIVDRKRLVEVLDERAV